MKTWTKILMAMVLSLFLVVPAFAIPIIDFRDGDASGGAVTVSGGNVTGTNIALDSMNVTGTAKNGDYDLTGALAAPSDADPDHTAAALNFNTATKTISIVGGVSANPITGTAALPSTTLLTGTITDFHIDVATGSLFAMMAVGTDTKDPGLLTLLGIDPTQGFTFLSFEIGANSNGTGSPYIADSTDVNNQGKVPEPISLILLGSGLAGAGLYRRLRKPRG